MGRLIVVSIFFPVFHMGISQFRIVLLLSPILNSTSDPRQDGQPSLCTSSPTIEHGMRSCRASTVAGREKPSLMEHQRLYPLLFAS